jgi:hypothetical protein
LAGAELTDSGFPDEGVLAQAVLVSNTGINIRTVIIRIKDGQAILLMISVFLSSFNYYIRVKNGLSINDNKVSSIIVDS